MKKISIFIIAAMACIMNIQVVSAQAPDIVLLSFEGVSFDNTLTNFLFSLKTLMGWEKVEGFENGAVLAGEYLGCKSVIAIEATPKTHMVYLMHIGIPADDSNKAFIHSKAEERLTKFYGEPQFNVVKGMEEKKVRIWEIPFKGYEMLDIKCGTIVLQIEEAAVTIKMLDSTHKILAVEEQKALN